MDVDKRRPDRKQQDGRRRSVEEGSGRRHSYKRAGWSMSTKKTAVVDVNEIFHETLLKSAGCSFLLVDFDGGRRRLPFSSRPILQTEKYLN